jgi:cold shock protein
MHPPMHQETLDTIIGAAGIVQRLDGRRRFGSINRPDATDIFVHFSLLDRPGFRKLDDGQSVIYDAQRTERGWKASRAIPLGGKAGPRSGPGPRGRSQRLAPGVPPETRAPRTLRAPRGLD